MRTTVTIDDELMETTKHYTGRDDRADAIRTAVKRFVEYEAARRLIALGGTMPGAKAAPRRRPPRFINPE